VTKPPRLAQMAPPSATPHQLNIAFDSTLLRGMSPSERAKVLAHLASLLTQAATVGTEEHDDDER
jgi:hypothetical protein